MFGDKQRLSLIACVLLGVGGAHGQTVSTSVDVPKAIPDANATGITSVLNVATVGIVTDVDLKFTLPHTCVGDLRISLISPDGTNVPLLASPGGLLPTCNDNFTNTIFSDQSLTSLAAGTNGYTGTFNVNHASVGNNPLARFNGKSSLGQWRLFVADGANIDVGTLTAWSLTITVTVPPGMSTDVPRSIPNNTVSGTTSFVDITQAGIVTDVNVVLDVTHTCVPDLVVTVTPPGSATPVTLINRLAVPSCPDDFVGTVLDDQAATNITTAAAPFTGSFKIDAPAPVGNSPLANFNGLNATGRWLLTISDRASGADIGTLNGWRLIITTVVPEGSSGDVPKAIPDANTTGISSVLTSSKAGIITDLNLKLFIAHGCVRDLAITLRAPTGLAVPLMLSGFAEGGILSTGPFCTANFQGTTFDDQSPNNLASGLSPYSASFNVNHATVGNNPLAKFNGLSATGQWTLTVADRDGGVSGQLNGWSLEFTTNVPPGTSTDVPKNITDNNAAGITSTVTIANAALITDLNLTLTLTHPCVQDLSISLTAPGGAPIPLIVSRPQGGILSPPGPCRANFSSTVLDDQTASSLATGVGPFAGSFNLSHSSVGTTPLANFNGLNAAGTWTLTIADRAAGNTGTLVGWSLGLTTTPITNVSQGLRFVPVPPCRLVDTRETNLGNFGFPSLQSNVPRSFVIPQQPTCGIPATAKAYSLNLTVVPPQPRNPANAVGLVRIWATGTIEPQTSTVNSQDGRFKANAAIVEAGTGGAVSVRASNPTDLVLDINGYFIDPGLNSQSLAFYPLPPCRVYDSRNPDGPLGGPVLIPTDDSRTIPVLSSNCGVPGNAAAYSVNATAVPPSAGLGFLTLWPTGLNRPFVSTLNAPTAAITANAAIVPAGTNGSINAFVSGVSHLVIDINGYFAPTGAAGAQRLFTVSPCRILDTRNAVGEFGGPVLVDDVQRSYRLPLNTPCGLPNTATAYALSATVIPTRPASQGGLGYLTLFPAGSPQPFVSTLNALDAFIASNAAFVPSGTGGAISSFVSGGTHLILDVVGFFQP